jgi:Xaa-Pro dipeptidase
MLAGTRRLAMQYSPRNAIMYVSMVDAGTVEFLRSLGKEIVSSADLVSQFEAVLTADQMASHNIAQRKIDAILAQAFREIGRVLHPCFWTARLITEFDMVQWFSEAMRREGLIWENGPNVSVGPNSADSHYEPTAEQRLPIRNGDFLLIDIWGKTEALAAGLPSIHYDITWTGVIGREPTDLEQQVFTAVRDARDAAIAVRRTSLLPIASRTRVHGYEPTMQPAKSSVKPASANTSPIAPATTSQSNSTAPAPTSTTSKPTTSARSCPTPASPSNPASTCPPTTAPSPIRHPQRSQHATSPGKAWVTGPRQQELVRI